MQQKKGVYLKKRYTPFIYHGSLSIIQHTTANNISIIRLFSFIFMFPLVLYKSDIERLFRTTQGTYFAITYTLYKVAFHLFPAIDYHSFSMVTSVIIKAFHKEGNVFKIQIFSGSVPISNNTKVFK